MDKEKIKEKFSINEDEYWWLRRCITNGNSDEIVSWHLREIFGEKTPFINRKLSGLSIKGFLVKSPRKTHTKFYFTEKLLELKKDISGII